MDVEAVEQKFRQIQVSAVEDDEEEIVVVSDDANERIARVTVDSGVVRCDVKKPLATLRAVNDEGNYIENDACRRQTHSR